MQDQSNGMYPNLYFFLKDVFGGEPWGFTRYVNSFGFFVALAFVASGVLLTRELRRKEGEGLLKTLAASLLSRRLRGR